MNECNDPDHGAINAERSESRGLRKAWIEVDDKRQQLERELTAVTEQRDRLAEALWKIKNTEPANHNGDLFYPQYTPDGDYAGEQYVDAYWLLSVIYTKVGEALAAVEGGSYE